MPTFFGTQEGTTVAIVARHKDIISPQTLLTLCGKVEGDTIGHQEGIVGDIVVRTKAF